MSVKHLVYIFEDEELKGADRLMMLAIADYCDEQGSCYPSYKRLAKKCNVTRRTAIITVNRLQENGHLAIKQFAGIETAHGNTNRFYMLKWRQENGFDNGFLLQQEEQQEEQETEETDKANSTSDTDNTPTSDTDNTLTVGNRRLTQTLTPATTDVARTEEQTPKNPAFKRTKELTETVLQVISEPVFGIQYETLKDRKNNFVACNMVNAFVDAYNTLGLNPSIQEVEQDIKNYHTYYMRKHKRITLPRQRDKVGLYFLEYMQQKTTSYQPQAQIGNKETELDKQMKALIKAEAV
jgi:hypothetical protein